MLIIELLCAHVTWKHIACDVYIIAAIALWCTSIVYYEITLFDNRERGTVWYALHSIVFDAVLYASIYSVFCMYGSTFWYCLYFRVWFIYCYLHRIYCILYGQSKEDHIFYDHDSIVLIMTNIPYYDNISTSSMGMISLQALCNILPYTKGPYSTPQRHPWEEIWCPRYVQTWYQDCREDRLNSFMLRCDCVQYIDQCLDTVNTCVNSTVCTSL